MAQCVEWNNSSYLKGCCEDCISICKTYVTFSVNFNNDGDDYVA